MGGILVVAATIVCGVAIVASAREWITPWHALAAWGLLPAAVTVLWRSRHGGDENPAPPETPGTVHLTVRHTALAGLDVLVATRTDDAETFALHTIELAGDVRAWLLTDTAASHDELAAMMRKAFAEGGLPNTATTFVQLLDDRYPPGIILTVVWDPAARSLGYLTRGFEAPTIINVGWPHRSEATVHDDAHRNGQALAFGVHVLSVTERWLLYTPQLVHVPDPQHQPFNTVGIIEYARTSSHTPDSRFIRNLLDRGVEAHGGQLPRGAILAALVRPEN